MDRLSLRLVESPYPGWEWRSCEDCGEDFQAPVGSDYRRCQDCENLGIFPYHEARVPKPTDTPQIGDVLVIDGKKFVLDRLVSPDPRNPEGYRVYVFKAEDGEEIQVPMKGNKRAESRFTERGYNTIGYFVDGDVYCYKDAFKLFPDRMKAYDRPGIKSITPTRANDVVWKLVCMECGKALIAVY